MSLNSFGVYRVVQHLYIKQHLIFPIHTFHEVVLLKAAPIEI